jgi:hypothetical protein
VDDDGLYGVIDRDGLAGLETELDRSLPRRVRRDLQRRVELEFAGFDLLEHDVKRHDFRHRRWMTRLVGIDLVDGLAGVVVYHYGGKGRMIIGAMNEPRARLMLAVLGRPMSNRGVRTARGSGPRLRTVAINPGNRKRCQQSDARETMPARDIRQAH